MKYQCPKCGVSYDLIVEAKVWCKLSGMRLMRSDAVPPPSWDEVVDEDSDLDFDEHSPVTCTHCQHEGELGDFEHGEDGSGEITDGAPSNNPAEGMDDPDVREIVVEVTGGVADVTKCPSDCIVKIVDHDNIRGCQHKWELNKGGYIRTCHECGGTMEAFVNTDDGPKWLRLA